MNKKKIAAAAAILLAVICVSLYHVPRAYGDTKEFRDFMKIKSQLPSIEKQEPMGENVCRLSDGTLLFLNPQGEILWKSDPYWYVDDFSVFDVDGDGNLDCLFSLWKSYSFYKGAEEDDSPEVKNHLFLYTIRADRGKQLWCSSNLPRPIDTFSLEKGKKTPVSSGTILKTTEGVYRSDYKMQDVHKHTYIWSGWGFVEQDEFSHKNHE